MPLKLYPIGTQFFSSSLKEIPCSQISKQLSRPIFIL